MGFRETLKNLTTRAQDAAAEHRDEIRQTVDKAEVAADQRTGGKYHDKIEQAGGKVDAYVANLGSRRAQQSQGGGDTPPPPAER